MLQPYMRVLPELLMDIKTNHATPPAFILKFVFLF